MKRFLGYKMEESYSELIKRVERNTEVFGRRRPADIWTERCPTDDFDLGLAGFAPYRPVAHVVSPNISAKLSPAREIIDTMEPDELFLAQWIARFRLQGRPHQKLAGFLQSIVNQPPGLFNCWPDPLKTYKRPILHKNHQNRIF